MNESDTGANNSSDVVPNSEMEQYKLLVTLFDNELSRFYMRQNIYLGIHGIVLAAIISNLDHLAKFSDFLQSCAWLLTIISGMTLLVTIRGCFGLWVFPRVAEDFERCNNKLRLYKLTLGRIPKWTFFLGAICSTVIILAFVIFWSYMVATSCKEIKIQGILTTPKTTTIKAVK